jgi:uncharacterized protein (DUF433 family)
VRQVETDRFKTPLYTISEAAHYLGVPASTFGFWARGHRPSVRRSNASKAILTTVVGGRQRQASVPFVGLAEGVVLAGIRRAGVPLQRIRPAIDALQKELGIDHVLASKALYTDGAEVLYDFAERTTEPAAAESVRRLVVARTGQHVFNEVVAKYLRRIEFASDGYAQVIDLPGYTEAEVVVDPRRGFGQPTFRRGGAKVEDALGMFLAGESLATVAAEYGVPESQLEDALRVATRQAA